MERAPVRAPLIKNLEFKVGLLLALTLVLSAGFFIYSFYARGAFERTQQLILVAENAEGVSEGMTMSFSGFPIGRVKRMTLSEDGNVRIEMAVPVKDARWLRTSSVFTLEKSLVGGARIRAYSAILQDPPLPDGAERDLITGDATEAIPELIAKLKDILANVDAMTRADSSLNQSLANVKTVTERMAGDHGVMGAVLGDPDSAGKVVAAIDHANSLLKSLSGVSLKADRVLAQTDQRVFGEGGLMDESQRLVARLGTTLEDVRASLKKADAILVEAQGAAANARTITADIKGATTDLAVLRAEVDDSLAKVNHLIDEINRKWPFARDVEIKLP